jgi:trimeric autotransporter adhesin
MGDFLRQFSSSLADAASAVEDTASAAVETVSAAVTTATDTATETVSAAATAVEGTASSAISGAADAVGAATGGGSADAGSGAATVSADPPATNAIKGDPPAAPPKGILDSIEDSMNPAKAVGALVDLANQAEGAVVTQAVDYAQQQGAISADTAQTIKNVDQVAQGVRQGVGDLVGGALNTAVNPISSGVELVSSTAKKGYEDGGGGVTGVLNAAVALSPGEFMNPIPHAIDSAKAAYNAAESGNYKEAGRQGTYVAADVAAVTGALGEAGGPGVEPVERAEPVERGEPAAEDANPRAKGGKKGRQASGEDENFQRISDAAKTELENSGWLKEEEPNPSARTRFMKWLETEHKLVEEGGDHEHLRPGSPDAQRALGGLARVGRPASRESESRTRASERRLRRGRARPRGAGGGGSGANQGAGG